ncbi:cupin domain-containing protein [Pandoraea pneumonica]|uniref:cupin domain-containing protein n=1 Tax=Pandoraea pneumonica TaxID=2508299 RepID=UPI003CE88041
MTSHVARKPRLALFVTRLAAAVLVVPALFWAPAAANASPHTSGVRVQTLLKSTTAWDNTGYTAYPSGTPELAVLRITIAPNTTLGWHTHPIPNAAYVEAGELIVERADSGATKTYTAGQVLPELVDIAHRGVTGDKGADLIVFYASTPGQPLAIPAPSPVNDASK